MTKTFWPTLLSFIFYADLACFRAVKSHFQLHAWGSGTLGLTNKFASSFHFLQPDITLVLTDLHKKTCRHLSLATPLCYLPKSDFFSVFFSIILGLKNLRKKIRTDAILRGQKDPVLF